MDRFKLEYEMKRRNVSINALCHEIGMSRSAFYRKTHGITEFTQKEIQSIIDFLRLDSPMGIFFTNEVS
jgi:ACT domain-containing protein